MPTTRPRHVVTETDDVAEALDVAARHWPEEAGSRSLLLRRLVREGRARLEAEEESALERRLDALLAAEGALTDCYPADYLRELREDWAE